jgi:glucose/mannose-6-phosphate isomerase
VGRPYSDLIDMYYSWPEQFKRGYLEGSRAREEWEGPIVFCGMGGSGSAGDFASLILEYQGLRGVLGAVKGFKLPPWIGPGTLVVAVSYSGNTYETLLCVREAVRRRAAVLAVTSGGMLERYSKEWGVRLLRVTGGLVPRAALAEMVGAIVGALEPRVAGLAGDRLLGEVVEALERPSFEEMREEAKGFYKGGPVVVSSCGRFGVVAERWRTELGENSKVLAKSEVYPESGHNDIVAWQLPGGEASFIVVEGPWEPECDRIMGYVSGIYEERGPLVRYRASSRALPGALMEAALAGGFFSVSLALERGVDPADTSVIAGLKRALGEFRP